MEHGVVAEPDALSPTSTPIWDEQCLELMEPARWPEYAWRFRDVTGPGHNEFDSGRIYERLYSLALARCSQHQYQSLSGYVLETQIPPAPQPLTVEYVTSARPITLLPSYTVHATDDEEPVADDAVEHAVTPDFLRRVMGFGRLQSNWDGYGASPISPSVIEKAIDGALQVRQRVAPLGFPFAAPSGDGSILLRWVIGARRSIEAFVHDNSIVILVEDEDELRELEATEPRQLAKVVRHQSIALGFRVT